MTVRHASFRDPRSCVAIAGKPRRGRPGACPFGECEGRRTHMGLANGMALMSGCEFHVRMWVKYPIKAMALAIRRKIP